MDPSTKLHPHAPPRPASSARGGGLRATAGRSLGRVAGRTVLWLHGLADRHDLVPFDFGKEAEVDTADPRALAREWWRQARLWADYNPEEMFALKAGALALGLALIVLIVLVGAVG